MLVHLAEFACLRNSTGCCIWRSRPLLKSLFIAEWRVLRTGCSAVHPAVPWPLTRPLPTLVVHPAVRINTAKAGQYSYATGYGDVHQLLQTSAGERKTILRGVWCVSGLSSKLFSVRAHTKSARGNSCVLEFAVSVLRTLVFILPLADDPTSGLFSFSGVVIAIPVSALVAPAVAPPACSSKSTSAAPLDVLHRRLGHPRYETLSQLKSHVRDFVVTGSFKPEKILGPGCGCDTCVRCNLHRHPHTDTEAHTTTASGQLVHVDGASGFPCSSLVHAFLGMYLFVDDYSETCVAGVVISKLAKSALRQLRRTVRLHVRLQSTNDHIITILTATVLLNRNYQPPKGPQHPFA